MAQQVTEVSKVFSADQASLLAPILFIGGDGGSFHQILGYQDGKVITKLRVYSGESCIKAYTIWLTDDEGQTYGEPDGTNFQEYTFKSGERINSLTLWGNGAGTRAGWIEFTTTTQGSFSYGMYGWPKKTPYPVEVGSGILVGAYIQSGDDIDAHAFLFLNPVAHAELTQVNYPTLSFDSQGITPSDLDDFSLNNDSSSPEKWIFSNTITRKIVYSWSITDEISVHATLTVKSGFPDIADVEGQFGWEISVSGTYGVTNETDKDLSWSVDGTADPGTSVNLKAVVQQGTLNIPYTGVMVIYLENGLTFSYSISGWYNGVTYTDVKVISN